MVIYIPTLQFKYIVITVHDPILQEYYITGRYHNTIYKRFTRAKVVDALEHEGGISRAAKSDRSGGAVIKFSRFHYATLISNMNFTKVEAPGYRHADPGLSECNPTST